MASATGLAVVSNYFAQPLLPAMAKVLALSPAHAGTRMALNHTWLAVCVEAKVETCPSDESRHR